MEISNQKNKFAFTLIEILVVLAFIAILSSAILASISGQRDKARVAGSLAELSGVLQPILACKSDGGTISNPSNNGLICNLGNYGVWPDLSKNNGSYTGFNFNQSAWYFSATISGSSICCNNYSSKCAISSSCGANTVL